MANPRHRHSDRGKPDSTKLLVRVMSAMIGLTFGFAGGRFLGDPFSGPPVATRPVPVAEPASIPAMDAPLAERLAATVRMNADGLRGVLAAIQEEWVRQTGQPDRRTVAMTALRVVFSRWTDLDGNTALKAALEIRDIQLSSLAIDAVMTEWGLRDTLAASQTVTSIPWNAGQQRGLLALLRSGVQKSPAEGLGMAAKLALAPQNLLRRSAGAEWLHQDASHALRFLTGQPGLDQSVPAGLALGLWLAEDPAGFTAWRREDPKAAKVLPLLRFPADSLTPARLARLQDVLEAEFGSAEKAAEWLSAASSASAAPIVERLTGPTAALAAASGAWERSPSAKLPANTAAGWLARLIYARTLARLITLAGAESERALDWLTKLPDAEDAAALARPAAAQWLETAPATAAAKLFAADLTQPARLAAAMVAVNRMIVSEPLQFLDSLGKLPLEAATAAAFRTDALRQLAYADPAALLDWLAAHPDAAPPAEVMAPAVRSLARTDAARAMQWVRTSAPREAAPALTGEIFGLWITGDRDGALAFLDAQPAGPARDALISQLIASDLEVKDTIFAANMLPDSFSQALAFSESTGRLRHLQRIHQRMTDLRLSTDTVLSHPRLRAEERATLTKKP